MKVAGKLLYALVGILFGTTIACTILMVVRNSSYMNFWHYTGYLYLPIYNFIVFVLPFTVYLLMVRICKIKNQIKQNDFFVIGLFFSLSKILIDYLIMMPFINNVGIGLTWFITPLIIFWVIVLFLRIKKRSSLSKASK